MDVISRHSLEAAAFWADRVKPAEVRPTYTSYEKNVVARFWLFSYMNRDHKRVSLPIFPKNWSTPSFHCSNCATLRGHVSPSWALVVHAKRWLSYHVSKLDHRFQSYSLLFLSAESTLKVCLHQPSTGFTVKLSRYREVLTWTGRPIATRSPEQCHGCSSASDNRCVLARCMRQRMPWYCRGSIPSAVNAIVQRIHTYDNALNIQAVHP